MYLWPVSMCLNSWPGIFRCSLSYGMQVCGPCIHRYADVLAEFHDDDHLVKFEELLEAAVDLDKIPDEYLICASYDAGLQVSASMHPHTAIPLTHPFTSC